MCWARKETALADTESIDHATVDVTGLGQDFRQVLNPPGHTEVGGVIDHGLDTERPPALEVGLHPGVPEVGVERDLITAAQQPRTVAVRGWGADPAAEHDLHCSGRPMSRLSATAPRRTRARGVARRTRGCKRLDDPPE